MSARRAHFNLVPTLFPKNFHLFNDIFIVYKISLNRVFMIFRMSIKTNENNNLCQCYEKYSSWSLVQAQNFFVNKTDRAFIVQKKTILIEKVEHKIKKLLIKNSYNFHYYCYYRCGANFMSCQEVIETNEKSKEWKHSERETEKERSGRQIVQ